MACSKHTIFGCKFTLHVKFAKSWKECDWCMKCVYYGSSYLVDLYSLVGSRPRRCS